VAYHPSSYRRRGGVSDVANIMREIRDKSAIWWLRRDGDRMLVACLCFVSTLMVKRLSWATCIAFAACSAHGKRKVPGGRGIYTGSILFVPPRGDNCRLRHFDNLTGRISDKGVVSCGQAMARSPARQPETTSARIAAIRKGFRRD
jgi:hypothetical protein